MKLADWLHWLPDGKATELVELHKQIVDAVAADVRSMPSGTRKYPFCTLVITVFTQDDAMAAAIQQSWLEGGELDSDLRRQFANMDVTVPEDFSVTVIMSGEKSSEPIRIQRSTPRPQVPATQTAVQEFPPRRLRLRVLKGDTETGQNEFSLAANLILVGRRREVFDGGGRLVRLNDIAFAAPLVSREHCQIRWDTYDCCYRLLLEKGKACTQVVRSGQPFEVPHVGKGLAIRSGDQIRMAGVVVVVEGVDAASVSPGAPVDEPLLAGAGAS